MVRTGSYWLTNAGRSGAEGVGAEDDVRAFIAKPVNEFPAQGVDLRVERLASVGDRLLPTDELLVRSLSSSVASERGSVTGSSGSVSSVRPQSAVNDNRNGYETYALRAGERVIPLVVLNPVRGSAGHRR